MTEATLRAAAEAEISRIAGFAQGAVGVAALHLESGRALGHNDAEAFPMASTVKVPIAVTILDMVDRGTLRLDTQIAVEPAEMNPSGPIGEEFRHPGVSLSVYNLLEPMITRSDNTATDVMFRAAGGPTAVQQHMRTLGITEIRIDRNVRNLLLVLCGVADPGPGVALIERLHTASADEWTAMRTRAHSPNPAYFDDPRDQATPRAMLDVLRRIAQADGVSAAAREVLLGIMGRTSTGVRRIAGRLPQGVPVADKTGSAAGTTNDAGIVTLPGGRGRVALVVYVKASALPPAEREDIIADISRTVFDYFVITTPGK